LAGDVASFLFFILLSRRFGPEGVGIYAFAVAVASIGRTVAGLGVDDYGVGELATRGSESAESVVGRILGTQCWLAAIYTGGCALFLVGTGVTARKVVVVGLLAAYHLGAGIVRSLFLPAFAGRRMAGPALLDSGSRILAIGIGIGVMLWGGDTLVGVLVGFPISGALLVMGAVWLSLQDLDSLQVQFNLDSVVSTTRQAWPFAAAGIVFKLHGRADVVMLSLIAGSAATGIYAAGLKFVEVSIVVVALFSFALYPRLTKLAESDEAGFGVAVATIVKGGFVACIILGWGIFVVVPDLIPLFFGSQFQETEFVIKLFALWVPVKGVKILGDRLMLSAGEQVQKLRLQTIATGLNIAFNGVLIPILVVEGAILASVVSTGINMLLVIRYLKKYSSERLVLQLITETSPLLIAGLLAAGVFAYVGTGEIWAAIAFIMSFGGAAVISGFLPMIWSDMARLVAWEE
jgi:O-antigen/teichoic acid export membrane protein